MADEISVPPEVLETFLKIKRLVDATVDQLQGLQLSASGAGTLSGSASISVVARPETVEAKAHIPTPVVATFSATLPALTASLTGHVSEAGPPVIPTVPEVNMAGAWVAAAKAAGAPIAVIMALETLLQFAARMLDLVK